MKTKKKLIFTCAAFRSIPGSLKRCGKSGAKLTRLFNPNAGKEVIVPLCSMHKEGK